MGSQLMLAQSLLFVQGVPGGQADGQFAPQSIPASVPFLIPSVHDGGWHCPPTQCLLAHSPSATHGSPGQAPQGPPQSTPVSLPFWILSKQLPEKHCMLVGSHWPL